MEIQSYSFSPFQSVTSRAGGFEVVSGASTQQTREMAETFGQEMLRRVEIGAVGDQEKLGAAEGSADGLAQAMADSVEFVRASYGDATANAFMATMVKEVGEQGITEESFGRAMLNSVRLIDSTYGFSEGDKLIRQLNGGLNEAVNDYFDNGFNEQLYTSTPGSNSIKLAMDKVVAEVAANHGEEEGQSAMDLLLASIEESDSMSEGLRNGLADLQAYLEEKYGPEAGLSLDALPQAGASQAPAPKGMLLNASV